MPRLPKTTAQRQRDAVVRAVDGYFAERKRSGCDCYAASAALGVAYSTLRRRTLDPGTFTLSELQSIANTLNVSLASLLGEKGE